MTLYSFRILRSQPLRMMLTVGGIALCAVLMLFLLSVYRGVFHGSVEYIRQNRADFWVLQRNQTNILRCTSILTEETETALGEIPGVASVSGILLLLSPVRSDDRVATLYLAGYDPGTGKGGPPRVVEGRPVEDDDEIVLDASFAAKFGFGPGDTVRVKDTDLRVTGLSTGTNAFVIQYAFTTLARARSLMGIPGTATCYLVDVDEDAEVAHVVEKVRDGIAGIDVFDHETFLENNVQEMQAGFLPFMYTIAALGVVVLTVILSLLLSINILEWRHDFAVMKTLGASGAFLGLLVVKHAVVLSLFGMIVAIVIFFPMVAAIEGVAPEVSTRSSMTQIFAVTLAVVGIGVLGAVLAMQRLRRIYPLEAF